MTSPIFHALPTDTVRALQGGAPDANGQTPERRLSEGAGNPCRHCLRDIAEGAPILVLAHRPFPALQPYAETGPIFLCADPCERHPSGPDLPPALRTSPDYLVKGYGRDDRIVYGTGAVVACETMTGRISEILEREDVAYVHIRSARNNCYQARADRGTVPV